MEDKYEALKLKNQLCFPIYLCAKEIQRRYTPYLDRLNLTYTQYVVMMYFWEHGGSNVKAIGETLLLDPSTLTPLLRRLEAKGYITRRRSELDEREARVILLRYGLDGSQPLTQRETAKLCRISRSYVSRIEKRALEKLREALGEDARPG